LNSDIVTERLEGTKRLERGRRARSARKSIKVVFIRRSFGLRVAAFSR